jgi:hypothetical protein
VLRSTSSSTSPCLLFHRSGGRLLCVLRRDTIAVAGGIRGPRTIEVLTVTYLGGCGTLLGPMFFWRHADFGNVVFSARPRSAEKAALYSVVCDAGHKSHSIDSGMPVVSGRLDLIYLKPSDEHGLITAANSNAKNALRLRSRDWARESGSDPGTATQQSTAMIGSSASAMDGSKPSGRWTPGVRSPRPFAH